MIEISVTREDCDGEPKSSAHIHGLHSTAREILRSHIRNMRQDLGIQSLWLLPFPKPHLLMMLRHTRCRIITSITEQIDSVTDKVAEHLQEDAGNAPEQT